LKRAAEADRDSPVPLDQRGFFLLRQGRVSEAQAAFQECLRRDPKWPNGHFGLGLVAERRGDPVKALGYYLQTLENNPMDMEAHLKAAGLYLSQGRREEAVRHLRRASELGPTRGETFFSLGVLLWEEGKLRTAEEAFLRALQLGTRVPECHLKLSQIYERLALQEREAYERELMRSHSPR
jgi:tetratricopeptide (TPR) repeat protein